jgi:hypothetical protein
VIPHRGRPDSSGWENAIWRKEAKKRMDEFFVEAYRSCGDIQAVVAWMEKLPVEVFDPDRE